MIFSQSSTRAVALVAIFSLAVFGLGACGQPVPTPDKSVGDTQSMDGASNPSDSTNSDSTPPSPPVGSDEAIAWEALMGPDGEYAAAASYVAILEKYGDVEPYAAIYQAELRHISALQRQLERMGVPVPGNPYEGKVTAPDDLKTAATAWAEGEILNVEMYDDLIAQASDDSLIRVLTNLRRASLEQHLPAFEQAAANDGVAP